VYFTSGTGHAIDIVDIWELNSNLYEKNWDKPSHGHPAFETIKNASVRYENLRKQSRKSKLPDNFIVTEEMKKWAYKNTPDVDIYTETERFIRIFSSNGVQIADWEGIWRKVMLDEQNRVDEKG
jgi:hypothetical protein